MNGFVGLQTSATLGLTLPGQDADALRCSVGWRIIGYFTPSEGQAHGGVTRIEVDHVGEIEIPASFVRTVKMEGWGLSRFGWFLGWNAGRWVKEAAPLDAHGRALVVGDVAVDRKVVTLGRRLRIPDLPAPWGGTVFTASDIGSAILGKHIDVYCGAGPAGERASYAVTGENRRVCLP